MRGLTGGAAPIVGRLRAAGSDEQGVSLALTALSLVWIVGLTSLVVDIGDGWLSRQRLIPATDAASLAAAQDMVNRPWDGNGACATAEIYVAENAPDATMTGCDVVPFGNGGRVTVTASEEFEPLFTDLSSEGGTVQSVSTAAWGPPLTAAELRPFGLCYDGSSDLRQLIDNPPSGPTWIVVDYLRDDPAACGGLAGVGNFVTIDFDGGASTFEIRDWMLNGYPDRISLDPTMVANCDGDVSCYRRPYASNAIMWELGQVRNRQDYVLFPVFDYADTTEVHLIGMVRARLYAFDLGGAPETWRIELKVDPGLVTGTCCGPPDLLSGNQVIAICGVDPDVYPACEPSAGP